MHSPAPADRSSVPLEIERARASAVGKHARTLWLRRLVALAVAAQGIINLLSAYLSHPPERLHALRRLVPTEVIDTSRTFTLLAGLLLLITAWGLLRGKRRAFVAALFLSAISVPFNFFKAFDFEEATAATALMFILGITADAFRVKSRDLTPGALRSRAIVAALALGIYAVVGCWILEARFGAGPSIARAAAEAAYRLFGVGQPSLHLDVAMRPAAHHVVRWFLESLPLIGATLVVLVGIAALRPVAHRGRHRAERARVQALLHEHGASSVSAFALAPDTDYYFSSNGRAVIAYRFESDTLLAIGDPIGPAEELEPLLRAFQVFCAEHDWTFAFFQARPELLQLYRSLGWRAIHVGEDPMLIPATFSLEGSAIGDARRATRKLDEAGWVARHFIPGDQPFDPGHDPDALLHQMQEISADWMKERHGEEKGFCMGRFDPGSLRESWLAVAWHPEQRGAAAFITWVPIWARRGWALDLMRRREGAPSGVMDFLVVKSVVAARARGDAVLSLSLSALSKVDEPGESPPGAPPPDPSEPAAAGRARQLLAQHLARFYDFQGLFHWKKKFLPTFEDRYLVYPDPIELPRVALALARIQSPGGLRQYLRPKG